MQKKLVALEKKKQTNRQNLTTRVVIISSILAFVLLFAGIALNKNRQKAVPVANLSSSGWTIGSNSARINLVEYSDFECPACRAYQPFVEQALQDLDGKIKFTYKYFPLSQIHKNALLASKAAEAAGKQNKFWQMHKLLFEKQEEWAENNDAIKLFINYAKDINLDINKFQKDTNSQETEQKVQDNLNEALNLGLNSTPSFILNGKILITPAKYQDFKALLEKEL